MAEEEKKDLLSKLTVEDVARWYGRLGAKFGQLITVGGVTSALSAVTEDGTVAPGKLTYSGGSLASFLLLQWRANRDPKAKYTLQAPIHLRTNPYVAKTLEYHRRVFLTEEKGRLGEKGNQSEKWVGIIPRLQGKPGFPKWDGTGSMPMPYQCLVEFPMSLQVKAYLALRSGARISDADAGSIDLFFGLHGFQLKSQIIVTAAKVPSVGKLKVSFPLWTAQALDRYNWDYSEHLTVPNPDFKSTQPWAVDPKSEFLTVYHKNAKRVEEANLAAPYDLETDTWQVADSNLTKPAEVDPAKRL